MFPSHHIMGSSWLRSNPQNLSGKAPEEKWTAPELVPPVRASPRLHDTPRRNRNARHYLRPSWKRNPKPVYKKILSNPDTVRADLELPKHTELRHIPENIEREHKQAFYYNQIWNARDQQWTVQHESIQKDVHEGQVRRTTIPARKHELDPERREQYENVIQDRRYDEDSVERSGWQGHGWLTRARAELEFPKEFDRLWEEWNLRGRRTSEQERELMEREREIEREEQEDRILGYVKRNMKNRERNKLKVLDRVTKKIVPRLRGGATSWEEVEQDRFWYQDPMREGFWPEALRYIDAVPLELKSFPGEFVELPGEWENPLERSWSYVFRDEYQRLLEEEEERPNVAVIAPEQSAFADVGAAEVLRQQFDQTHGRKKGNEASVEDVEEEEEEEEELPVAAASNYDAFWRKPHSSGFFVAELCHRRHRWTDAEKAEYITVMHVSRARKKIACVPCHERKVRCDASDVGMPCTRCSERQRSAHCTPTSRKPRRRNAHACNNARRPSAEREPDHAYQPCAPISPVDTDAWQRAPDDEHVQTLRGMAGQPTPTELIRQDNDRHGVVNGSPHVIEYFDRFNATALLTEALGVRKRKRLIRIELAAAGEPDQPYPYFESPHLPAHDMQYLRSKHVFDLPPPEVCHPLLRAFFDYVWPYTPVFDRTRFCREFRAGTVSYFLLYAVLANAVPYVDFDVLESHGYRSRDSAQREYADRAKLLHDFGLERRQLQSLQASIILSSFHTSFAPNADYRSWFQNAVRIATQIGLHRQNLGEDLEFSTHQLCRRIWWVLVQRDVLFSVSGLLNARCIDDSESDVAPLTNLDWPEDSSDYMDTELMSPLPITAKQFLIHNGELAQLGARVVRFTRSRNHPISVDTAREFDAALIAFRQGLPPEFHVSSIATSSTQNLWVVLLGALSQRLECVFFRIALEHFQSIGDQDNARWCKQRLFSCIFELDAVIKRAVVYDLVKFAPSSL
ncbi:uncharacterized protein MYCFIDRAFT_80434 [Pseudocercospora fijiensis CIRAD86]|uniref:Zn(2)-C6 fungal-type domain-containing protein n=1 Tax=Pseudocercospora fijiensis (strain CIRAD86) TaxID=383855 RepID=M3B086_PSEFD|nr:uncharacterized protein MYCFIDRAFT_80434 [Pseudocercospora fijiensis CIRAD86]EME82837.1 hypothetical protein MYCFIDRAFT_80434 [Pseudocercospora fijiensis CIRAD86]